MEKDYSDRRKWFPTYIGEKIDLRTITQDQIHIRDIAHHLSLLTRFGGATEYLDSVAQHSILVAMEIINMELDPTVNEVLWGLLHDAGEAYIGELKMGLKEFCPILTRKEEEILEMVANKFELPFPMPPVVYKYDSIVGHNEAFQLVSNGGPEFYNVEEPAYSIPISPWPSHYAENKFLKMFHYLWSKKVTSLEGGHAIVDVPEI